MNIAFDIFGNLVPYELISVSMKEFEDRFILPFDKSKTRRKIFENFKQYRAQLNQIIGNNYVQWIDGSYTTLKLDPGDIDFVTFIDYKLFEENLLALDNVKSIRYKKELRLDGYVVLIYPENHKNHFFYESDCINWLNTFGNSRSNRKKGIIQLTGANENF